MLGRYLSTLPTLGCVSATSTIRTLYIVDASKHATNKPAQERSRSSKHTSDEITRDAQDSTSARIPNYHPPSRANKWIPVHASREDGQTNHPTSVASNPRSRDPNPTPSPVDTLIQFLSGEHSKSFGLHIYDADTLSSLFISAEAAGQLRRLNHVHLSSLISLFGTITIFPARAHMYENPLASHVTNQPPHTYWPIIIQLAMQKGSIGKGLTPCDHYWLMRANLAIVNDSDQETPSGSETGRKHDAMFRAHREYHLIRRHSNDAEVHGPYFEALLSLQTPEHLHYATKGLCDLLGWSCALLHPRLQMVLWQIVLRSGSDVPDKSKEALLKVSIRRLWRHAKKLPDTESTTNRLNMGTTGSRIHTYGIVGLADSLTAVIASPLSSKHKSNSVEYRWALSEALANFSPQLPFAQRWNSLVLLALYNTVLADHRTHPNIITKAEAVHTDWDVICVLATLQKLINCIGPSGGPDSPFKLSVRDVGQSLWAKWSGHPANRPKHVSRTVAISFFQLAAIAKDAALTTAVDHHCISSELWSIGDNDTSEATQIASLATEYISASFNCGTDSVENAVAELHDSFRGVYWEPMIRQIFSNFSLRDVRIASELYSLVHVTTNLPTGSTHSLAMSLVSQGFINVALPFFRDSGMSHNQTRELLNAVLLDIAKRQHAILHPDVATVVGEVMHTSYTALPPTSQYRAVIQHILPVLASSRHAAKAGAIFETILGPSPSFFSKAFILRFLPVLIKHQQYRLVRRILESLAKSQPSNMEAFRKVGLLGLSRGGAITPAVRTNSATWQGRNYDFMVKTAHGVKFRIRTPALELSLKITSILRKYALDGPAAQLAMQILVRAGRILAAKRLFLRTREHLDIPTRTSLGNVILDCYTEIQHSQRMRKVLSAYDSLIQQGGLIPDRVTVNIMLKAILRWRNVMNSAKLRILFDHVVRNGYTGQREMPFCSSMSNPQVFKLPELDGSMSFERHVRPMLRMFIKAFHVRSDIAAARVVIGILKSEQMMIMEKRDKRRRARKAGRQWVKGSTVEC